MMNTKYYIGDSRKLISIFKKRQFVRCNAIITSPPYYNIKNYETERQIGYGQNYEQYLSDIVSVLVQCYELSKNDATLWLVLDTVRKKNTIITLPFDINRMLLDYDDRKRWHLRDVIIWDKYKNVPWHNKGRLKNKFEYVLFFSKSGKYRYNIDNVREINEYKKWWLTYPERYNGNGSPPSNIWQFQSPLRGWGQEYQSHLCPFPYPLAERIISIASKKGDLILDPFAGSGTVLAIANVMERNAVGIDINKEYRDRLFSKVLAGARKYWSTRKSELDELSNNIRKFKRINLQLRKIKGAIQLVKKIQNKNRIPFKSVFISNTKHQSKSILYLISDSKIQRKSMHKDLELLTEKINSEFKINIAADLITVPDYLSIARSGRYLYGYLEDQIYRYANYVIEKDIFSEKTLADAVYSNIKLDLQRSVKVSDAIS